MKIKQINFSESQVFKNFNSTYMTRRKNQARISKSIKPIDGMLLRRRLAKFCLQGSHHECRH